jgi:hypothetical protein
MQTGKFWRENFGGKKMAEDFGGKKMAGKFNNHATVSGGFKRLSQPLQ